MADRPAALRLTLYSRQYCHLCAEMRDALVPLCREFGVSLDEVDVDADPELERRYNELVPLLAHEGRELARWRLDAAAIRVYLSEGLNKGATPPCRSPASEDALIKQRSRSEHP